MTCSYAAAQLVLDVRNIYVKGVSTCKIHCLEKLA